MQLYGMEVAGASPASEYVEMGWPKKGLKEGPLTRMQPATEGNVPTPPPFRFPGYS